MIKSPMVQFLEDQTHDFRVKRLRPEAVLPRRATPGAAGYDLVVLEGGTIPPGETRRYATGLAFALPTGTVGLVRSRSSAFKRTLLVSGTYDEDYSGDCFVQITNAGWAPFEVKAGACYAQIVIVQYYALDPVEVLVLEPTQRGDGALGSTGNTGA